MLPEERSAHSLIGVFGVPLEILVEKTGSDSQLGATNTQLRVPEFIDNIISAMKQMGKRTETKIGRIGTD